MENEPLKSLESARGDPTLSPRRWGKLMISLVAKTQQVKGRALVTSLCRTLSIGRSCYYPGRRGHPVPDLALRNRIHKLSLSWHSLRLQSMTRVLQRMGYRVNHKHVLRRMREDNLIALRCKAFVSTTGTNHDSAVYANLVTGLNVTGINQF